MRRIRLRGTPRPSLECAPVPCSASGSNLDVTRHATGRGSNAMTTSRPTFRNVTMFGGAPDWSAAVSPDFDVAWTDRTDAQLGWDWDDMHHPFALAPLS